MTRLFIPRILTRSARPLARLALVAGLLIANTVMWGGGPLVRAADPSDLALLPRFAVNGPSVVEGHTGATSLLRFKISLLHGPAPAAPVTIAFQTQDGSATSTPGPGRDYLPAAGQVTFLPGGDTVREVPVTVIGDRRIEPDETMRLLLRVVSGSASLAVPSGAGTILNDDDLPTLSIDDRIGVVEPHAPFGPVAARFTVTLSHPFDDPVTVAFETVDGSARANDRANPPGDYQPVSGTLDFAPGGPLTQTIDVPINDDGVDGGDDRFEETYRVKLSNPVNATFVDSRGNGSIIDFDQFPPDPDPDCPPFCDVVPL
jgi:hypothetical protein